MACHLRLTRIAQRRKKVPRAKTKVGPTTARRAKAVRAKSPSPEEDRPEDQQKIKIVNAFCPLGDRQELIDIWRKIGCEDADIQESMFQEDQKLDTEREKITKEREKCAQEILNKLRQKLDRDSSVVEERAADKADALRRQHAKEEAEDKQRAEQEVDDHRSAQAKQRLKAAKDVLDACGLAFYLEEFLNVAKGGTDMPVNEKAEQLQQAVQGGIQCIKSLKEVTREAQEEFADKQLELADRGQERKETLESALEQVDRQRRTDLDALEAMHEESVQSNEELVELNTKFAEKEDEAAAECEKRKKEFQAYMDPKQRPKILEKVASRFDLDRIMKSVEMIRDPPPSLKTFLSALSGVREAVRSKGKRIAPRPPLPRGDGDLEPAPLRRRKRRAQRTDSSASLARQPQRSARAVGGGGGGVTLTLRSRSDRIDVSSSRSRSRSRGYGYGSKQQ